MKNYRILIVDDNKSLHEDFKKILLPVDDELKNKVKDLATELFDEKPSSPLQSSIHYELSFADQGETGYKMALEANATGKPYALVFMDVRMPPGWDGITTISKIWETLPMTQIVICTAYSDYSLDDIIEKLGVSERVLILKKPFDTVEVQQLALALTTKWNLEQLNLKYTENLEELIIQRTKELEGERARSVNSAKLVALGEMAGGIAHEINNPLAIILTNVEIQKELLGQEKITNPKILTIADKIETTTLRIAKIIRGLRAFSRSGENDPFESVRLLEVIQEAVGICAEKFKSTNVNLIFNEMELTADLEIACRNTQIIQVLLNLLNNSYDAVQTLTEKWIKINVEDHGDKVLISLTDSGKGITDKVKDKLFQPFFTTKEIGQGTGLGLSISKGIIEDHKGVLALDSQCKNTRFTILLPKLREQAADMKVS